jgi:peptidoglycan-N-acetylmuramic acid deacetylase
MGYTTLFWSFAYLDYDVNNQKGTDYAYDIATKYAHNGAIYLLHAVSKDNAAALSRIIDTLHDKGYELSLFDLKY